MKSRRPTSSALQAFTLVEMIVVVCMVVLIASVSLPGIVGLFEAGADSQAYNLLSAQLMAARALAMERNTYAGIHIQRADGSNPRADLPNTSICYLAAVMLDPLQPFGQMFVSAPGFIPRRVPGHMGFGDVSKLGTSTTYSGTGALDQAPQYGFTRMTIVFAPGGSLATKVNGVKAVGIKVGDPLIALDPNTALWAPPNPATEAPSRAVVMFDLVEFDTRSGADKDAYLNERGQIIPINAYTGVLFPRK